MVCCTQERPDDGAEERQYGKGKEAREERPEIPARIAYRPEQRGNKRDAIKHYPAGATGKNQDRGNHHHHAHYQEVPTSPTEASLKPNPPTARPMSIISPASSHCRIRGIPRGALPNAISVSFRSPAVPEMYQLGNKCGGIND
jgi:hypothetical protein